MSSWKGNKSYIKERKIVSSIERINDTNEPSPSKYVSSHKANESVICSIALNEERYIQEWINYHLALGFNHIFIYDNSDNNILNSISQNKVTVIHFPGKTKQFEAYNDFISKNRTKYKWGAFIDCDEFIVLKKHENINNFLSEFSDCESIGLNWIMFGTSKEKIYKNEPVTSRFRYCSRNINQHIKCITKLKYINTYVNPHYPILTKGGVYDTNRKQIYGPTNNLGTSDIACIHHYYTKSEEEFKEKMERGRADVNEKIPFHVLLSIHDEYHEIYNSDAWDFYSKHI